MFSKIQYTLLMALLFSLTVTAYLNAQTDTQIIEILEEAK